jgi:hypothetical protein
MNTGADYSFTFYDGDTNAIVTIPDIEHVSIKAEHHELARHPYNDDPSFDYQDAGFSISFEVTRSGSNLELASVKRGAAIRQGKVRKPGYLNKTIKEADGTVTRLQYQGFVFALEDHGDVSRDKVVKLRIKGKASRCIQIA